jgi:hypothetical protein
MFASYINRRSLQAMQRLASKQIKAAYLRRITDSYQLGMVSFRLLYTPCTA